MSLCRHWSQAARQVRSCMCADLQVSNLTQIDGNTTSHISTTPPDRSNCRLVFFPEAPESTWIMFNLLILILIHRWRRPTGAVWLVMAASCISVVSVYIKAIGLGLGENFLSDTEKMLLSYLTSKLKFFRMCDRL